MATVVTPQIWNKVVLIFHASCNFLFKAKKTTKHLETTLSIVIAMSTLSIGHTITTDLATEDQAVEVQDRICDDNQVVEVQGRASDSKVLVQGGDELAPVVDLFLDSDQVIEHDDVSLQKKSMKLIDREHIIMKEELTDTEINLA